MMFRNAVLRTFASIAVDCALVGLVGAVGVTQQSSEERKIRIRGKRACLDVQTSCRSGCDCLVSEKTWCSAYSPLNIGCEMYGVAVRNNRKWMFSGLPQPSRTFALWIGFVVMGILMYFWRKSKTFFWKGCCNLKAVGLLKLIAEELHNKILVADLTYRHAQF